MIDDYKDIINLPHHVSTKHSRMSLEQRSAQFAPFAALTGYSEQVKETARITDEKIEIEEEVKEMLDYKLRIINEKLNEKPMVTFTYFIKDKKKDGGKYITATNKIKKIDFCNQMILLENGNKIDIDNIIDISTDEINAKFEL